MAAMKTQGTTTTSQVGDFIGGHSYLLFEAFRFPRAPVLTTGAASLLAGFRLGLFHFQP
jgi:hypothetical protein